MNEIYRKIYYLRRKEGILCWREIIRLETIDSIPSGVWGVCSSAFLIYVNTNKHRNMHVGGIGITQAKM